MRINRYLALCGLGSRRKCEEYILKGEVSVNNVVITDLATTVHDKKDIIYFRDNRIQPPQELSYYLLNKPAGYLVSKSDPHHRATVYSLLTDINQSMFHVGRLDQDSEGALLFTNDGKLAHRLLHPKYDVPKRYTVEVDGYLTDDHISQLKTGIQLEEGRTKPAIVKLINRFEKKSSFHITISQGWKRQIRRMAEAIGLRVIFLRRDIFGILDIADLPVGKWRKLNQNEIRNLKKLVKLP